MMRLPWVGFRSPTSIGEAARILAAEGPQAMLIAGGTDLLHTMKRRHQTPATLVSLGRIDALKKVANGSGAVLELGTDGDHNIHIGTILHERAPILSASPGTPRGAEQLCEFIQIIHNVEEKNT